jgi:transmembrane sensor
MMPSGLVEHALTLIAAAEMDVPDGAARKRNDLDRWRSRSPEHEAAYEEALGQWQSLAALAPELRERFAEPATLTTKPPQRTKIPPRGALCLAAFLLLVAGWAAWQLRQPTFDQLYTTDTAQIAKITLPDGSRIDLNARSTLQVTLFRDHRTVRFKSGDARFEITPDAKRPFRVQTRAGTVEVIGTLFVVSDRGGPVSIMVQHGRVRFLHPQQASLDLTGGERLTLRDGVPGLVERAASPDIAEWREGWLVFDNEPLAQAVRLINAFREKPIQLADTRTGLLRLTGRFRATDSAALLAALPRILPVKVIELPDGSAEILRR